MRERKTRIIRIIYHIIMGEGEGGSSNVSIVYSIRMGGTMLGGGTSIVLPLPFCIKPDKLIAVDNLNLMIDCPPLNKE